MSTNDNNNNNVKVSKDSDKYKVALKLINKILVNIGKQEIDDLVNFVNIDREDIIKECNKIALVSMENELFTVAKFDKKACGYYRKNGNAYVLNLLRGLMKEMGYEMTYIKKEKNEQVGNKSYKRSHYLYSIK